MNVVSKTMILIIWVSKIIKIINFGESSARPPRVTIPLIAPLIKLLIKTLLTTIGRHPTPWWSYEGGHDNGRPFLTDNLNPNPNSTLIKGYFNRRLYMALS